MTNSIWISGGTRTGKTSRLVTLFRQWVEAGWGRSRQLSSPIVHKKRRDRYQTPALLILAANSDNRRELTDRLTTTLQGRYPVRCQTPLGFFQDEVILFWPLLIQRLNLRAQFPLRLRPETEQDLAMQLWRPHLESGLIPIPGTNESVRVRRLLDLLQLAALSGTPIEEIPRMLEQGVVELEATPDQWELIGKLLLDWRGWCLDKGLLTYSLVGELYWREMLPDATYKKYLTQRYRAILADDVDEYPAIARDLFDLLLDQGIVGAFTYNPQGQVRLGLNADPDYLSGLASRCQVESLPSQPNDSLADALSPMAVDLLNDPMILSDLPEFLRSLQTTSRAQLLRRTAEVIVEAVKSGQVEPGDIAIIAPGLDAIARYTLTDILSKQGIPIQPLNEQRPLISSPLIRALLTLLTLVYPGLGRLVDREAIAEMLVVLSHTPEPVAKAEADSPIPSPHIDPVRAGLLADYCYSPDPDSPHLLAVEAFARWDRLGHRATTAYTQIQQWLEVQREQQQQRLIPSCVVILDRAIQKFLWNGSNLPYDQIAALRELMETAQHYWEVDGRLRKLPANTTDQEIARGGTPPQATISQFIQLLRRGTVTANSFPLRRLPATANSAVTLATIFQYRAARGYHRWHFWLDAGSHLWSQGGAATLFAAPLFLKDWFGQPWTEADKIQADEERLQRILQDLLGRVGERVYLCHSDLAVNGTEQTGPLLNLVHSSIELTAESVVSH
ncbi:MAG: recombinase family protein [Coleofasciculus sp.]